MRFLLEGFQSSSILLIFLIAAMVAMIISGFFRRRKEQQFREELENSLQAGARIKTYTGIYATVVSMRNTTDGKIVLIETGEGDKKSYQQIHIDAIYGIDKSEEVVIDADGNEVPLSELNKKEEDSQEAKEDESRKAEEKAEDKKVEE